MVVINIEVRHISSAEDLPDYCLMDKKEAIFEIMQSALYLVGQSIPQLVDNAYNYTLGKGWEDLPDELYIFKHENAEEFGLAAKTKKSSNCIESETYPIYLVFDGSDEFLKETLHITYTYD